MVASWIDLAVAVAQRDRRGGDRVGAGGHLQADQFPQACGQLQLVVDHRLDVFVEDFLFLVGQRFELSEGRLDLLIGQRVAQLHDAILERVPAAVLAQHQRDLGMPTVAGSMIS